MAKLKFKWGVMNSGKSQELLRVWYNYKSKNDEILVLVPAIDDRFGQGKVTTRAGQSIDATAIQTVDDIYKLLAYENIKCVLIDEVQFFTQEMIEVLKKEFVLKRNVPVIAYGLKTDFKNDLFEGSKACLIYAEEIIEIETECKYCNRKAIMNQRTQGGKPVRTGKQIMLGDNEYVQVCNEHWLAN